MDPFYTPAAPAGTNDGNIRNKQEERRKFKSMTSDEQLWDHLIAQGAYNRHHAQRLRQHLEQHTQSTQPRRDQAAERRCREDIVEWLEERKGSKRKELPHKLPTRTKRGALPRVHVTNDDECNNSLAHIADAQCYTRKLPKIPVCRSWPVTPVWMKLPGDMDWDLEHGDGVFTDFPRAVYSPPGATNYPEEDPFRDLLYRAWERAMHAASTTLQHGGTSVHEEATTEFSDRSRDRAERVCEQLHLALDEGTYEPAFEGSEEDDIASSSEVECPSCRVFTCTSLDRLQDHYYGTSNTQGCCWTAIDRIRRSFVLDVFDRDAHNQVDQLLGLSFQAVAESEEGKLVDCFDIYDFLEDVWSHGTRNLHDDSRPRHLETLQVEEDQPPLLVNQAILDSLLRRITERYSRVPK